jgi:hypothetical protein
MSSFATVHPQTIHVDDIAMMTRQGDRAEDDPMRFAERSTNKQMHVTKATHRE